jgi:hypothetical protein
VHALLQKASRSWQLRSAFGPGDCALEPASIGGGAAEDGVHAPRFTLWLLAVHEKTLPPTHVESPHARVRRSVLFSTAHTQSVLGELHAPARIETAAMSHEARIASRMTET